MHDNEDQFVGGEGRSLSQAGDNRARIFLSEAAAVVDGEPDPRVGGCEMNIGVMPLPGCMASVFLLAENRLLREALVRVLGKKGDINVLGAEPYSEQALRQVVAASAHIVVLDSITTALSGARAIRRLHEVNPSIKIVMVGMESDEAVFLRVVQEGAVGYVLKDASALDVARTIRAVAAGEAVCPPSLSVAPSHWVARHRVTLPSLHLKQSLGFSLREQQLVQLIREGLSNKEMASRLNLSEQTVKNHVHRMLRKAGAPDRLAMVELCRAEGATF
jgi:DNA-binding NarL/FixJ family response regulator